MTRADPSADPRPGAVLVTGGSAGIGLATARLFAERGARVAVAARSRERLEAAARQLADATGATVVPLAADLADPAAAGDLVRRAADRLGALDAVVNNAGWAKVLPIPDSDPDAARSAFDLNVLAVAESIRAAWPIFRNRGGGRIVNVSSWAALDPFPGFFLYSAAKAAVNLLTKAAAAEGAAAGVRVFSIAPGAVETALLRSSFGEEMVPPAMCLDPREVAELIVACATGLKDDKSGRTIYVRRDEHGGVETIETE